MKSVEAKREHVDTDIEASALGAVLCAKGKADHLVARLIEADFADERHRLVFAAMVRCGMKRDPVDVPTVAATLRATGQRDAIEILPRLVESVGSPRNAEHYVDRVRDLGARRRLASLDLRKMAAEAETTTEALNAARAAVDEIARGRQVGQLASGLDLAKTAYDRLEQARQNPGPKGITTGFPDLDRMLSGLRPACLYVLAARPGQGKTALGVNIAMHVASRQQRALVFSLEMSTEELADRALCSEGHLSTDDVARGNLDADDWAKASRALGRIGDMSIHVDDRAGLQVSELVATAKAAHAERACMVVLVDYLQLVRGSVRRRESREQEVAEVARELKGLAKDLGGIL